MAGAERANSGHVQPEQIQAIAGVRACPRRERRQIEGAEGAPDQHHGQGEGRVADQIDGHLFRGGAARGRAIVVVREQQGQDIALGHPEEE